MKNLLSAAEKGNADAQFNLGVFYDSRIDDNYHPVKANRVEAIKWLLRAAQQGLPRAQIKLAQIFAENPTTEEDLVNACAWFLLAAVNSSGAYRQDAQDGYSRASSYLSSAQLAKADQLAQLWKPQSSLSKAS